MALNTDSDSLPRIILGAGTFGLENSDTTSSLVRVRGASNVAPFLEIFHAHGLIEVDTARVYLDSENVLSELPTAHFKISTKVFPSFEGAFDAVELPKQFRTSLEALKANKVDILYLHRPDFATPLEVTAKAVNDLYKEGLFERFGLSNYPAWQVVLMYEICKQNGYVLPSVYQGLYNPIARAVQPELLPCLKHYNIGFNAYSPTGGGLLTGKYKFADAIEGRYDPSTTYGKFFRERYWNSLNFDAIQILDKAAQANNITLLDATLRWMRHHSGLGAKDGIVLGASNVKHLKDNLAALEGAPLPQAMIDAFDEACEVAKPVSQPYFWAPDPPLS